jgi:hypothetical protein
MLAEAVAPLVVTCQQIVSAYAAIGRQLQDLCLLITPAAGNA